MGATPNRNIWPYMQSKKNIKAGVKQSGQNAKQKQEGWIP
jgi:hypothetical protein